MTLVLLCVILSVCVSITHLVPLAPPTSFIRHFWNFEDFLLFFLFSFIYIYIYEDVHVLLNFDPIIFYIITAFVNWEIAIFKACVHNSSYIFNWILLKFRMFSYHYMKICMWFWIVEPVSFKVTDEALLAETVHYCPYSLLIDLSIALKNICFRFLFAQTLGNIWHSAFIYQNATTICLQEYFFLLIIISWQLVFYFHFLINKTMNKTNSFVSIDTYIYIQWQFNSNAIPLS